MYYYPSSPAALMENHDFTEALNSCKIEWNIFYCTMLVHSFNNLAHAVSLWKKLLENDSENCSRIRDDEWAVFCRNSRRMMKLYFLNCVTKHVSEEDFDPPPPLHGF